MPDPMTERLGQPNPEILKPENYGVYGRLLLATQPNKDIPSLLNPENTDIEIGAFIYPLDRDYKPITERLSSKERTDAWTGIALDEAKRQWLTRFTTRINGLTDSDQIWAVQAILGKQIADFIEADASALYDRFCQGKSDTTAFTKHIVGIFQEGTEGKIDRDRIKIAMPHVEWLAGRLFGNDTAKVVGRIVELESGINNEKEEAVRKIFADPEKIKTLSQPEIDILKPVFLSFQAPAAAGAAAGTPPVQEDQGPIIDEDDPKDDVNVAPPAPDVYVVPAGTVTGGPPSAEPPSPAPEPEVTETEPVVDLKDIPKIPLPPDVTPETLVASIKSVLSRNPNVSRLNVVVPINIGKDYLVSTFKGGRIKEVKGGQIEITGENEITVLGIRLRAGIGPISTDIVLDLILKNGPDGVIGKIDYYEGRGKDEAEKIVGEFQPKLLKKVDNDLKADDPQFPWTGDKFTISGENVLITVHNTQALDPAIRRLNPT